MAWGYGVPCPKPEKRSTTRGRRKRALGKHVKATRGQVFGRQLFSDESKPCLCCQRRRAESMHEVESAGAVGSRRKATSVTNSIPVCGDGVRGCHGRLQRYEIRARHYDGAWLFVPQTQEAERWMGGQTR
jgi:hypothetical protein